jgi:hypothetical protein
LLGNDLFNESWLCCKYHADDEKVYYIRDKKSGKAGLIQYETSTAGGTNGNFFSFGGIASLGDGVASTLLLSPKFDYKIWKRRGE